MKNIIVCIKIANIMSVTVYINKLKSKHQEYGSQNNGLLLIQELREYYDRIENGKGDPNVM